MGRGGSGTIFLSSCNLSCVFCQNYTISHLAGGRDVSEEEFVRIALTLEDRGAHNINLVSPTHQAPALFDALEKARRRGLSLPIVYNCGGYENVDFLRSIDGLVDIYMPDAKVATAEAGRRYLGAADYPEQNRRAVKEMHRQVGTLSTDGRGVALRGLLVRHLVMPGGAEDARSVIDFLCEEVSPRTFLNIMDQYHPAYRAREFPEIDRRVSPAVVDELRAYAAGRGMNNVLS